MARFSKPTCSPRSFSLGSLARLAAAVWWANTSDERALAKMNLVNETVQLKVPKSQRT
jgi:hypothetical protein